MMIERQRCQATPSVYFNFDYSNQKTNENNQDKEYVPYDYSFSTNKHNESLTKRIQQNSIQIQCQFATPPSYVRNDFGKKLLSGSGHQQKNNHDMDNKQAKAKQKLKSICVKLNTQQFFDEFDKNFVVNFGDSPLKNQNVGQFRKTFESCPGGNNIKESMNSKLGSNISEPLARRLSIQGQSPENQQDFIQNLQKVKINQENKTPQSIQQKQNKRPTQIINEKINKTKLSYDIRKRVILKSNERIVNQINKKKHKNLSKIINYDNLLIVTSSGWDRWTDKPRDKKNLASVNSQPIKRSEKELKKTQSNIFTTRHFFKQTLRSTTLDSWKKKFTQHKNQLDLKHKNRPNNIFQKPFSLIR